MQKYIQDTIRNNLRPVIFDLTKPQQKAATEMMRGLFTAQAPILAQLVQKVEWLAFRKAKQQLRKDTIIAYDLTDIAKERLA